MPADAFRPRSTSEILDASIQLLRAHYPGFLALSVLVLLPQLGANVYNMAVLLPQHGRGVVFYSMPPLSQALLLAGLVWFVLADTALMVAASDAYLGFGIRPRQALRQALRRGGTIVLAVLLKYVLIFLGLLAVMIAAFTGGVIFMGIAGAVSGGMSGLRSPTVSFILGTAVAVLVGGVCAWWTLLMFGRLFAYRVAIVIEGLDATASLRRSSSLARGSVMKVILAFLLLYVIYFAVYLLLLTIAYVASDNLLVAQTSAGVVALFVYPIIPIVTTLLYYDLRIRKEGYDIELMAGDLGPALGAAQPTAGARDSGLVAPEPLRGQERLLDSQVAIPEPRTPNP